MDEYSEVINGPTTYVEISRALHMSRVCAIGWTDGASTHHDILFAWRVEGPPRNRLMRGLRRDYLFVSVIGIGAFGFEVRVDDPLHPAYVAEKLNLADGSHTIIALTELVNEVMREMVHPAADRK